MTYSSSCFEGELNPFGFFPYVAVSADSFISGDRYGDKRISDGLSSLKSQVLLRQSLVIQQLSCLDSEQQCWYRLLKNDKLSVGKMIDELIDHSQSWSESDHVLLVQDTTYLNYNTQRKSLRSEKGLGATGPYGGRYFGYLMHPTLVVDASSDFPLGLSDLQLWHHSEDLQSYDQRKGGSIPIDSKSSYRWISAGLSSSDRLGPSIKKTVIADREADIYEAFCEWKSAGIEMIVRSSHDRKIVQSPGNLRTFLAQQAPQGECQIDLKANPLKNQPAKKVRLALRFGAVDLLRSHKASSSGIKKYPETLGAYVLEAKELGKKKDPIYWRLISSHPIESMKDAMQILHWYKQRWHIEQLFRLMKNKGLKLEDIEYQYGESILKMGTIAVETALKILQLNLANKTQTDIPIKLFFSSQQIALLSLLCKKYEGKTIRQKNPFQRKSFTWATWILARMGGWKPSKPKARPGPITFKIGWERFQQTFIGFDILRNEEDLIDT